jgi:molybdopterin/thiamine biosynthesis adenylyltransferase/predicted RNA-binding Zn-ribbon protein involved in translation (DUF1610 family)
LPTTSVQQPDFELLEDDRYSRQRLIAGWDQERLSQARILVAGAGALGNEVLKNLALAGVGHLLIVDFDRVEITNLSRSVLFHENDIGSPKASTAAHALQRLNPQISVHAIDGDLEIDLGLGEIRDYDLVLGCLDSVHARWALNRACQKAGRAWIDAGINSSIGEVALYINGKTPCYECGMTQQMWRQIHDRRSCMLLNRGLPDKIVPTTAIISSLTAAVQVNEALAWIHGKPNLDPGEMVMVSLSPYAFSRVSMQVREGCLAHDYYPPSHFISAGPDELTVVDLLGKIPGAASLQLDFDVVAGWLCPNCGEQFTTTRLSQTSTAQAACPECGTQRSPQLMHETGHGDRLAGSFLRELGVPARSILRVKTATAHCYVEIGGAAARDRSIR